MRVYLVFFWPKIQLWSIRNVISLKSSLNIDDVSIKGGKRLKCNDLVKSGAGDLKWTLNRAIHPQGKCIRIETGYSVEQSGRSGHG